jgi:hypothetical protein
MTLPTFLSEGQPSLTCACCGDPLGFEDEVARATAGVRVCGACLDRGDYLVPTRCPSCGSRAIYPLFWVDCDVFQCENAACLAITSGRGD